MVIFNSKLLNYQRVKRAKPPTATPQVLRNQVCQHLRNTLTMRRRSSWCCQALQMGEQFWSWYAPGIRFRYAGPVVSMWENDGKLMENSEVDLHGVDVQRSEMFRVYAAINPACFFPKPRLFHIPSGQKIHHTALAKHFGGSRPGRG